MGTKMDSKVVSKELNSCVVPFLKKIGFKNSSGRTYWRYANDKIDIINFQSFNSYNADIIGCTTYSFAVNFSCFLNYIPSETKIKSKDQRLRPMEYQGHFRYKLQKGINQPEIKNNDIWYIDNTGRNLIDSMIDCGQQIEKNANDWFFKFDDKNKVFDILINAQQDMKGTWGFGNLNSPIRNEYTAYTAIELRKFDIAIDKLEQVSSFYLNQYQQQKYQYYLDRKKQIDYQIEIIKNTTVNKSGGM
jgi:hypothetical protein